ncbi:MAG: hypothetical protein LUG54_02205 [Clostridiales bacterium]|nr:hypothetical protein [Clostridiales bacterium]
MRKDIKEQILSRKKSALHYAGFILKKKNLTYEEFDRAFTAYLCDKFMLEPSEINTDDFYEICQISADKAANLPKGALDASELASKCGGATTAMNKKVLFLLAVNREYGIEIKAEESVRIETFSELKELVYEKIRRNKSASTEGADD